VRFWLGSSLLVLMAAGCGGTAPQGNAAADAAGPEPRSEIDAAVDRALDEAPPDKPTPVAPDGATGRASDGAREADAPAGDASSSDGRPDADLWSAASGPPPAWAGPTVPGTITVDRGKVLGRVGQGFLGLSFEKSHMTDGFFSPDHAALVALFRLLGPCVLRIGANDADRTTWDPAAPPVMGGSISRTVGTAAVDALAGFLKATGWRAIYAVNFKTGTPENAAAEAKYVAGKLGGSLYGFELGNEINLAGLPYPDVKTRWEAIAAAVRAQVPNAPLIGPATNPSGLQTYFVPFAKDEAAQVVLLTHHYYRGSGTDPASTMEKLLSPDPRLIGVLKTMATAATANHIRDGFRLGETASFSSHGAPGVSDAFGAALWAIDFLFDNAANGSGGINFHGGGLGMDGNRPFYYSPIGEVKSAVSEAKPVFYGMLLMALAGNGTVLGTTAGVGSLNFSAHALAQADGSVNVFLVNKDASNAVNASVDLGGAAAKVALVYLEGPSLTATSGSKIAGAGISPTGAWKPSAVHALEPSGPSVSLTVPPATAALIHAR
jgi:hypothetical protein